MLSNLKKNFVAFTVFVIIIALFVTTSYALLGSHIYGGIDQYKQEKSLWCWNACARMVADYRYSVTLSQTDMASKIFWPLGALDQSASMQQTASAIKLYTDSTKNTGYTNSACSFNTIAGKLDSSNNPLTMGIYYSNTGEYHMLACNGYDTTPSQALYYVDPKGPWSYHDDFTDIYDGTWSQQTGMAYFLDGQW